MLLGNKIHRWHRTDASGTGANTVMMAQVKEKERQPITIAQKPKTAFKQGDALRLSNTI